MFVPLNIGTAFQTEMGPQEANCPKAISMRNSGSPARININTYGIRNVAETGKNSNRLHPKMLIHVTLCLEFEFSLKVFSEFSEFRD